MLAGIEVLFGLSHKASSLRLTSFAFLRQSQSLCSWRLVIIWGAWPFSKGQGHIWRPGAHHHSVLRGEFLGGLHYRIHWGGLWQNNKCTSKGQKCFTHDNQIYRFGFLSVAIKQIWNFYRSNNNKKTLENWVDCRRLVALKFHSHLSKTRSSRITFKLDKSKNLLNFKHLELWVCKKS